MAVAVAALYFGWRCRFLSGDATAMRPLMFFRPFVLQARQTLVQGGDEGSGTLSVHRLTFALEGNSSLVSFGFDMGHGDFVQVRPPGHVKARSYSPTSPGTRVGSFDIVVKEYPGGRVSGFLAQLQVGDVAEIAGPAPVPWLSHQLNPSTQIGMVAFGVGITEALPVARAQLGRLDTIDTLTLLWACRRHADTFWEQEVASLTAQYPQRLRVVRAFSREQRPGYEHGRVDQDMLARVFDSFSRGTARFLVVGTKQMKRDTSARLAHLGFKGPPLLQKRLRPPWRWRKTAPYAASQAASYGTVLSLE